MQSESHLEAHFELFGALVAKWLSDSLWRFILSSSGLWWPIGSVKVTEVIAFYDVLETI